MADFSIVDSGYLKTDNSGTQLSTSLRANSGSEINLKAVEFNYSKKANIEANPNIATFDDCDVTMNGFDNADIVIKGKILMTDSNDRALIVPLIELSKTKGWKAIYYDSATSSPHNLEGQLVYYIAGEDGATFTAGEKTAFSITNTNVKHLCAFFSGIEFRQNATQRNTIDFTLTGKITKKNTPNSL